MQVSLSRPVPLPVSPHLRQSHVLKMINEDGEEINRQAWPPRNVSNARRPHDYLTKIASDAGKKVAWPPHLDHDGINEEYLSQQDPEYQGRQHNPHNQSGLNQNQVNNMDQQMMSQQYQQQVSSSQSGYKVLNQSYQVQQYQYEQQFGGNPQSVPITMQHQYQIKNTQQSHQTLPGQQFQIPIQRVQSEGTQQQVHQGQFQAQPNVPHQPQGLYHGQPQGQFQAQPQGQFQAHPNAPHQPHRQFQAQPQGQFQAQPNVHNLPQGIHHGQPQGQFQGKPQGGAPGSSFKLPVNPEMVKEWPPQNDGPNLTTTYPSGFKLKDELQMSQPGQQVVTSQPAFKITQPLKMRGDTKWPPRRGGEEEISQEEVREFIKPKKQTKDYSEFFAQNALPNNYPGYRAPPGTQHHGLEEEEAE